MARATAVVRLLGGAKEPVRLASTANLALSGLLTVDGVVTVAGDRVLVKNQTDAKQNGIYTASEGAWYRAGDSNSDRTLIAGMTVFVQEGTQANNIWILVTDRPDIGTDNIVFQAYLTTDIIATASAAASAAAASAAAAAASAAVFLVSVPTPQGRLTLTSGTPLLSSDVISATTVYYTPFVGNLAPINNGTKLVPTEFSELSLLLNSNHAINTIYDVFVFLNSGVPTLVTGPAWSNSAAASGLRGTGGGTSQLARVQGFWTNAVSMTGRNGSNTYSVGQNYGTYLGSIFIDGTAGQVTCHSSYGQSRKWGVWNAYNRSRLMLQAGDATSAWNYQTNTVRPSNNSSANSLTVFAGLAEEKFDVQFRQNVTGGTVSVGSQTIAKWRHGIGWNNTTAMTGFAATPGIRVTATSVDALLDNATVSRHVALPVLGINVATCLETFISGNGTPTVTWNGGSANMIMTAEWMG